MAHLRIAGTFDSWMHGPTECLYNCAKRSRLAAFMIMTETPADRTAVHCPSCRNKMSPLALPGKVRDDVELDLCFNCQGIWLDNFESQQIAPSGIIDLLKLIHQHRDDLQLQIADALNCPRCNERLARSMDIAKSGRFTYYRCGKNHGRFTVFGQFMIEKGFVRQLNPLEIRNLADRIGVVHCSCCGAPVNIRTDSACTHCHAPIAILDPDALKRALENYRQAEAKQTEAEPAALAEAIMMTERQRKRIDAIDRTADRPASLVEVLIDMLAR